MIAVDVNGGPPSANGAERWHVAWWTWKSEAARDDEDGFLEDQLDAHGETFTDEGAALKRARELARNRPPLLMGFPTIAREVFEVFDRVEGLGSWERVGHAEDVEP